MANKSRATGIGLFRLLYGLVTLQEIIFLNYFDHLIFDPIPFIDVEFPGIPLFLSLWGIAAVCIVTGYRYQIAVVANYLFWLVFVNFTPLQRDFDGGFDTFMIGLGFFLLFMPGDRAFSIDSLRRKLSRPFVDYSSYPPSTVSALAYQLPVFVCLGWLYLDSDVHKLFAEHWRNGLGTWLPATQPYYVSAIDMSPLLNMEYLQKTMGYLILLFQATFLFWFAHRKLRVFYLVVGVGLHLGITLTLNIYPFGVGMLICYVLLVPFRWWRSIGSWLKSSQPVLTVFYDKQCPLCNRTVLTLNHFDLFNRIAFKNAQDHAQDYPELDAIGMGVLMTDLYALDTKNRLYAGVDTYRQILLKMRYMAFFGGLLGLPGIRQWAELKYRAVADSRQRINCDSACNVEQPLEDLTFYHLIFERYAEQNPKTLSRRLAKIAIVLVFLQLNSTIHYGIFYRLPFDYEQFAISNTVSQVSNALLMVSSTFVGITPHALYLHDHFAGYDRILGVAYLDEEGAEHWLPFVNEQGRLLAPNWGRVHSMWANIAVTPTIDNRRVKKFIMKVTAFWGRKIGLDLENTVFIVKMKKIGSPTYWVQDQLHINFDSKWVAIGSVRWREGEIYYDLPADINSL